jgi:hypothetical protein
MMGLRVVEIDVADDEGGSPVARRSNPSSDGDAMSASPYAIAVHRTGGGFWVSRSGNPARGVVTARRIALDDDKKRTRRVEKVSSE